MILKLDLMGVFSDLQRHPDQRQTHLSLREGSHQPQPQGAPNMDILYIKLILRPSPTKWWCSWTFNTALINARRTYL